MLVDLVIKGLPTKQYKDNVNHIGFVSHFKFDLFLGFSFIQIYNLRK